MYLARMKRYRSRALTVKFHRIATGELRAARAIARSGGAAEHRLVEIPELKEASDIPGGRFEGLPPTYIPMRNSVFYSLAASFAEEVGASYIIGGHNREDREVFADATPEFFQSFQRVIWAGSRTLREKRTTILRPLQLKTKPEVIAFAAGLEVPFELTWSCHREGSSHCWNCEGCTSRERAFRSAGIRDPLRRARE